MFLKGKRIIGTDEDLERADRRLFLRYGMAVTGSGIIAPARKHFIVKPPPVVALNLSIHYEMMAGAGAMAMVGLAMYVAHGAGKFATWQIDDAG